MRVEKIARRRIEKLLRLAFSENNEKLARRYVELAWRISMRNKVRIPGKLKRFICRRCFSPLVPGRNAIFRVDKGRITIICLSCGYRRRIPYK